ncbi:MAG TPA: hypothetical protein VGL34_13600 [Steroidobacteraceae bacterium]|jgi:hypothetical protein
MAVGAFLTDPLRGKTPLARVFWVYGLLGSILYSAIGLALDPGNEFVMGVYTVLGLAFSIYVTVATYLCAGNCQSKFLTQFVRLSTIISVVVVLPLFAYLYFTGALSLALGSLE